MLSNSSLPPSTVLSIASDKLPASIDGHKRRLKEIFFVSSRVIERQRTRSEDYGGDRGSEWLLFAFLNFIIFVLPSSAAISVGFIFITSFPGGQSRADVSSVSYYHRVIILPPRGMVESMKNFLLCFILKWTRTGGEEKKAKCFFDNLLRFAEGGGEDIFAFFKTSGEEGKITNCTRWSWLWIQMRCGIFAERISPPALCAMVNRT